LQKALLCNPNYPTAHLYLGNILIYDSDQAGLQEVKKALELDPLQPSINWALGRSYYCLGQFDLCITQLTNAINVKLDFPLGKTTLAMAYIHQHEFGAARKVIDQMPETFNANLEFRGTFLSLWYAAQGKAKEAEMVLKETREKHEILSPFRIAEIQLALGNIDKAFEYLNRAYAVRDINLLLIKGPPLESLSSDPRFKAMLKKMNLN
jgi:tetratricopeptide (TPR) repeat protein